MMSATSSVNLAAVIGAVTLGLWGLSAALDGGHGTVRRSALPSAQIEYVPLPNGERGVRDESGVVVPIRDYQRVVSASTIADALLLEFAAPHQVAAFTQYSSDNEMFGYRYSGKPQIDALKNMEGLLALKPDLLLVSTLASGVRLERLRELGLPVFSLGEMRGVTPFLRNVRAVSALLKRTEQGELYAASTLSRLEALARHVPAKERKTAIQLTYYGSKIYGSGSNTSYTDVLRYAGLADAAADKYEGWPSWSPEQVLELNPDVIVTRTGMGAQLCSRAAFTILKACRDEGSETRRGIIELPDALLNDPGIGMVLSAERIHHSVYGQLSE